MEEYKSADRATNESPAIKSNQCLGQYADKLLIISKMQKLVYPQLGFTGLDMKRIHGGMIACEDKNELIRNWGESPHSRQVLSSLTEVPSRQTECVYELADP